MRVLKIVDGAEVVEELLEVARAGEKDGIRAWAMGVLGEQARVDAVARWVEDGQQGPWAAALMAARGVRGAASIVDEVRRVVERRVEVLEKAKGDPKREARLRVRQEQQANFRALAEAAGIAWAPELPEGWECCERGVWPVDGDGVARQEKAARCPVLIAGMQQAEGEQLVELTWSWDRGATWERAALRRSVMRSVQALVSGSADEVPVDSGTAAALVRWLGDLEAVNKVRLPCRKVANRLGWRAEGFVLGQEALLYAGAESVELAGGKTLQSVAASLAPVGTWEGWLACYTRAVKDRPLVVVPVLASVASVLLHLLREPGFVVSLDGDSGGGKTVATMLGVSVWAQWEEYALSWDAKPVGVEDRAALLQHLPLVLDETQRAPNNEAIQALLYQIPNGVGRVRGSLDGEGRKTRTWRLVLMSTGEKDILDCTRAAGAAARTISVKGKPFGEAEKGSLEEKACAEEAQACEAGTKLHSGHLGRRVLEVLLRADPEKLRAEHKALWALYAGEARGAGRRLARYLAVLDLAQQAAEEAGLPRVGKEPLRLIWEAAQQSGQAVDVPAQAWEDLQGWVLQEAHRFMREPTTRPPQGGWAGWISGAELCIYKHVMVQQLMDLGYKDEVNVVLRGWADRGWMHRRADKLTSLRVWQGERVAVYSLKRRHLEGDALTSPDPV